MVANPEPVTMTVEEYLALEETSQEKHEYVHSYVYAMSGGTLDHDAIANNVWIPVAPTAPTRPSGLRGPVIAVPVLGGLHHMYRRAA